jgi:hypothetical protein
VGGKALPSNETVGGKDARDIELESHLNETTTDSDTGEAIAADGVYDVVALLGP